MVTSLRELPQALVRRRRIDRSLDWLRFRIDTFPRGGPLRGLAHVDYQPLPWVRLMEAARSSGSYSRLAAISPLVSEMGVENALDLGCDRGFFTASLAAAGVATTAVECDPPAYRTALYTIRRAGLEGNAGLLVLRLTPATVELLPSVDAVLCLSLWHHLTHDFGLTGANQMMETIWSRTRKVLFFETGEEEMPASFGLPPLKPTGEEWIRGYLERTCPGGEVIHLGRHRAFAPDGSACERNLFAVRRHA